MTFLPSNLQKFKRCILRRLNLHQLRLLIAGCHGINDFELLSCIYFYCIKIRQLLVANVTSDRAPFFLLEPSQKMRANHASRIVVIATSFYRVSFSFSTIRVTCLARISGLYLRIIEHCGFCDISNQFLQKREHKLRNLILFAIRYIYAVKKFVLFFIYL